VARRSGRLTWRFFLLAALLLAMTGGIVYRLVSLQIVERERYAAQARDAHRERRPVHTTRGAILDRNGFPLAVSVDAYDIYADRRDWRDEEAPRAVAAVLARALDRPAESFLDRMRDEGPLVLLAEAVDADVGRQIAAARLPGLELVPVSRRFYPEGDLASAVLGFLGRDHRGLAGLELDLDEMLNGVPGAYSYERDSVGRPIAFGPRVFEPGTPAADVRLTLDRYIQRLIEEELDRQIKQHQASGGTIIVMEPKTGAILAMASRPAFRLSQLDLEKTPLDLYRDRAVSDVYEPGSVLKTITMAAAIDLGLVNPGSTYFDAGVVTKGGFTFKNWDFSANGTQTMTQVLQKSLNTGAIWLSDLIGPSRLYDYVQRFGFGESTHSGLSGEAAGLLRTNKDPGWYPADLATNSYGQGIAATPLQVITAFAAVINGGNLMRPYLVQRVTWPGGERVYEPVVVRHPISPAASATLVKMLNDVVEGVPHHFARVNGYHVGGKTGTTLVSIPTGYALDSTLATFVGFAPVEDPAIIMLIKIDQPQDDPLGGIVAAPVFGKLAPSILAYLNVRPFTETVRGGR
jgi:cell division protein FtsI/penicillin-binding protein 2